MTGEWKSECDQCGAPGGVKVIRRQDNHLVWSGECGLKSGWTMPRVVRIVQKAGLCEDCYLAGRKV